MVEDPERRRWAERNLINLKEAALSIVKDEGISDFADVMNRLRYRIATRVPLVDAPETRIRIMTLHSAKGLEGDVIVAAGLAHQMIPGFSESDPQKREEQRRLLYVAITRAREELVLSWPLAATFSDAATNNIVRSGGVFTAPNGERYVRLSKTSFLPASLPTPEPGLDWLQE